MQSLLIVAGSLLMFFITLLIYKYYLRFSTRITTANGISSLEEIELGGLKQWIFIRGTDQKNPILIFLHGGPGEPALGMSSSRKSDAELIKHYTVVHWDQRGAGKTYNSHIPVDSMTLDRLVEDCNELIDYLRNRFGSQKVFIVAHSSGTLIGIRTVHKYPEKIHAYVGVSQVINDYEQQRISYEFIVEEADKSGNVKDQNAIKEVGPPTYETPEKEFEKARLIIKYGGMMYDFSMKKMLGIVIAYFTSPEYSLSEAIRTIRGKGLKFTTNSLWQEIIHINLTREIESIKVPIYFFGGKSDMITPTVIVEDFYNGLVAEKGKKLVIFENSGHWPMMEEKEKYQDVLINVVLKENQDTSDSV
ncbi:MAG: alpha/beta fold hydrolase [Candidatus Kariarchaeaceae archaeon]